MSIEIEMEFFDKRDIPCSQMQSGAVHTDKIARYLEKNGANADTVKGICPRCGTKINRIVLPDGGVSYLPGKGWPELCPELKRRNRKKVR